MQKIKYRTSDIKYNIEAGFAAALNMMDKRIEFKYIPMTSMNFNGTPIYYVGERNPAYHEVIINGSVEDNKFVAYFVYGQEIVGFLTVGFTNLHLYLWEAMKLLIFPSALVLNGLDVDYKNIVN